MAARHVGDGSARHAGPSRARSCIGLKVMPAPACRLGTNHTASDHGCGGPSIHSGGTRNSTLIGVLHPVVPCGPALDVDHAPSSASSSSSTRAVRLAIVVGPGMVKRRRAPACGRARWPTACRAMGRRPGSDRVPRRIVVALNVEFVGHPDQNRDAGSRRCRGAIGRCAGRRPRRGRSIRTATICWRTGNGNVSMGRGGCAAS